MNKVVKGIIGVLLVGGLLSGCAGLNDSYEDHALAYEAHMEYDSMRMSEQTAAIMLQDDEGVVNATRTELILMQVIKVLAVSQIEPAKFTLQKPTTAYDVAIEGIKIVPGLGTTLGMTRMVDTFVSSFGDETYTANGSINVHNKEIHTTAIGDDNEMASQYESSVEALDNTDNSLDIVEEN